MSETGNGIMPPGSIPTSVRIRGVTAAPAPEAARKKARTKGAGKPAAQIVEDVKASTAANAATQAELVKQADSGGKVPDRDLRNTLTGTSREKLRQTVAKIERLEEEKTEVAGAIKEVYGEAKSFGFDTKALRAVIRLRKMDKSDREELEMMTDTYLLALGDI